MMQIRIRNKELGIREEGGFTLVETLVAISLLTIAIVAPIALTAQSLSTAYYARDQITAFYLAQEGIEIVRSVRDSNVLKIAIGQSANLLDYNNTSLVSLSPFTVDSLAAVSNAISQCPNASASSCPALQTNGNVYGYTGDGSITSDDSASRFTRYVTACYIQSNGQCNSQTSDEIRVSVTVLWRTGNIARSFTISEDMYRWVNDNAAG
jgi:Tfp pilus assembly protein PilV